MANVRTPISGIVRNSPDSDSDMGSAQELINLRYKDNAWRAIGKKKKLGVDVSTVNKQLGWYHHPSNDDNSFISFDQASRKILLHNIITGSNVVVKKRDGSDFVLPSGEDFNCFTHLENILVLLGTVDRYNFLFDNNNFELIEFPTINLQVSKSYTNRASITFTGASHSESIALCKADYIRMRSESLIKGEIEGITMFRCAIELFDGSYINYTDIKVLFASGDYNSGTGAYPSETYNAYSNFYYHRDDVFANQYTLQLHAFTAYKPNFSVTSSDNNALDYYIGKGIIKNVKLFSTKPLYPSLDGDLVYRLDPAPGPTNLSYRVATESAKISYPSETDVFYEIRTFPKSAYFDQVNNMNPSCYRDIETREVLPVDNFTAHQVSSKYSFVYNKRLHLSQIYTKMLDNTNSILILGDYSFHDNPPFNTYVEIVFEINNKTMVYRKLVPIVAISGGYIAINNDWWFYPDVRAKMIRLSYSVDGVNFYIDNRTNFAPDIYQINFTQNIYSQNYSLTLRNSDFSFLTDYTYSKLEISGYTGTSLTTIPPSDYATPLNQLSYLSKSNAINASYIDTNRVQLSETSNPFVLPALNSYRFGDINNEINGVELTKDQLSETRFGQFPLYVFSTQGVFALEQGTGSVAYASTNYIDKYIVEDHECIKAIKGYVVFRTKYGIYALAGRTFQEISTQLEGNISVECSSDAKYNALLAMFDNPTSTIISDINPLDTASMICSFDFINDEVWFSPKLLPVVGGIGEQGFSYIFNIVSKKWYKVSEAFSHFVDISPNIIGIKESKSANYVYSFHDMHDENGYNDLKLIVSRPISFNSKYYKRIEHFIARLKIKSVSAKTLYFYLYGSIDGIEYKIIQGGEISTLDLQDQEIRRTFVDFKWLQIVIAFKHETCEVMGFESEIKEKFKTKLR